MTSGLIDLDQGLPIRETELFPPIDSTHTFVAGEFAADGRRILGFGFPGGELFVYSLDTRGYQHFPEARAEARVGNWLPDGRSIAYIRDGKVFTIDTQSGEIRELSEIDERLRRSRVEVSWDLKSVYSIQTKTESDIWLLDYGNDTEDSR